VLTSREELAPDPNEDEFIDEEEEVEDTPRRSRRLSSKTEGSQTHSARHSRPRRSPSPEESEERETRSSARRKGKVPAPPPAPALRSAMKRLRVSSADAPDGTAWEESVSVSRTAAKRPRRGPASQGIPDDVDPNEVADAAFLSTMKSGPPSQKTRAQHASSVRGKAAAPPASSGSRSLSHQRPPRDDDDTTSTRSQSQRSFVPADPAVRKDHVPEPALSRKYASIATQTERCFCDGCEHGPADDAAPASVSRSSARTRSSELANTDLVPNGLLSMPPQGPANAPEPPPSGHAPSSSHKAPTTSRPRTSMSTFSSTVIGTNSDGTPRRQFHVAPRSFSFPRPRLPSRSPSRAPTFQSSRSSPLKPRAGSEYYVSTALSQIQDYSATPDLDEPDLVLDEKDDDDPIESESPTKANTTPGPSSSEISLSVPTSATIPPPRPKPISLRKPTRLSEKERQTLVPGRSISHG
jgi:hypothetical protein